MRKSSIGKRAKRIENETNEIDYCDLLLFVVISSLVLFALFVRAIQQYNSCTIALFY